MALFDNGELGDFLLSVKNFNMKIDASETLAPNVNIQYICTILRVEELRHFDILCNQVGSTTMFIKVY